MKTIIDNTKKHLFSSLTTISSSYQEELNNNRLISIRYYTQQFLYQDFNRIWAEVEQQIFADHEYQAANEAKKKQILNYNKFYFIHALYNFFYSDTNLAAVLSPLSLTPQLLGEQFLMSAENYQVNSQEWGLLIKLKNKLKSVENQSQNIDALYPPPFRWVAKGAIRGLRFLTSFAHEFASAISGSVLWIGGFVHFLSERMVNFFTRNKLQAVYDHIYVTKTEQFYAEQLRELSIYQILLHPHHLTNSQDQADSIPTNIQAAYDCAARAAYSIDRSFIKTYGLAEIKGNHQHTINFIRAIYSFLRSPHPDHSMIWQKGMMVILSPLIITLSLAVEGVKYATEQIFILFSTLLLSQVYLGIHLITGPALFFQWLGTRHIDSALKKASSCPPLTNNQADNKQQKEHNLDWKSEIHFNGIHNSPSPSALTTTSHSSLSRPSA